VVGVVFSAKAEGEFLRFGADVAILLCYRL
jgi:hypothetical protein